MVGTFSGDDFEGWAVSMWVGLFGCVLGVAYPLCINAIQRLKDEYRSDLVLGWFTEEQKFRCLRELLWVNLGFSVLAPVLIWLIEQWDYELNWHWVCVVLAFQLAFIAWLLHDLIKVGNLIISYSSSRTLIDRCTDKDIFKIGVITIAADRNDNQVGYDKGMQKIYDIVHDEIEEWAKRDQNQKQVFVKDNNVEYLGAPIEPLTVSGNSLIVMQKKYLPCCVAQELEDKDFIPLVEGSRVYSTQPTKNDLRIRFAENMEILYPVKMPYVRLQVTYDNAAGDFDLSKIKKFQY
ncbi:MAG: hypothetical protein LIP02_05630 [Bacteroidales bacterium]|nr:hypothetical protein [Bacteroidales bacterium]